jgi:hypothetical protein
MGSVKWGQTKKSTTYLSVYKYIIKFDQNKSLDELKQSSIITITDTEKKFYYIKNIISFLCYIIAVVIMIAKFTLKCITASKISFTKICHSRYLLLSESSVGNA